MPAPSDDFELIRLCLNGDQRSARKLYDRYKVYVARILFNLTRSPEAVEDLVQETFIRVFRGLESFRYDSEFKTWLTTIAKNVGRNYLGSSQFRKQRRTDTLQPTLRDENDMVTNEPADDRIDTESATIQKETMAAVDAVLYLLSHDQRETLILWNEGYTYEEIAKMTGTNAKTVGTRIYHAVKKLRAYLQPGVGEETGCEQKRFSHR